MPNSSLFRRLALAAAVTALLVTVSTRSIHAQSPDAVDKAKAAIAVLRSDAAEADKALACKHLAIYGSADAVPELAKVLENERLHSWARTGLEAIPGPEADAALRAAASTLSGNLLVGTLNSIGVRKDAGALPVLTQRLADRDPEVASAAAVALGHVGTPAAISALKAALPRANGAVQSAIAEGCILAAEGLVAAGKASDAVALFDEIRKAPVPAQRKLEATRGAILARGEDGAALLVEQLQSPEQSIFRLGLTTAREVKPGKCDTALVAELPKLPANRAALVLRALADRKSPAAVEALVAAAAKGNKETRLAALESLGAAGNATALAVLLEGAVDADADLAKAVRENSGEPEREEYLAVFLKDTGRKADAVGVIKAAREFLKAHPNSGFAPEVRLKLAESLLAAGDVQGARVEFEELAASNSGSDLGRRALFLAAHSASRSMDPASIDDSLMLLERVAGSTGADQLAWQARLQEGALKNAQNLPVEALAIYEKILSSNGENAPDPEIRAAALMASGDTRHHLGAKDPAQEREAIKAWRQLSTDPSFPLRWRNQALCKTGLVLEKLGDGDAALAAYYEAFKNPRDSDPEQRWHDKAAFEAARLLVSRKQWNDAVTLYGQIVSEGGPRAEEAKARLSKLKLENFLWEN